MKKVVCFGEILWDNFPAGPLPGGAPMNVSYHLQRLGIHANLVSSVGKDTAGDALNAFLQSKGLDTAFLQTDEGHATGQVEVKFERNEPVYTIVFPAAWDFIQVNKDATEATRHSDVFIYGSLAARNINSRDTLFNLLEEARYCVMDVNLRAPHYDIGQILKLIAKADLLKVNQEELSLIYSWLKEEIVEEQEMAEHFIHQFGLQELIVTKGSAGASLYKAGQCIAVLTPKVKVVDTVGCGDAFLAGFLAKKMNGESDDIALMFAAALAAFIASSAGACPDYVESEVKINY